MKKDELKALPKILQEVIDVSWQVNPIICDFCFDDDSLYATTRGADGALYFPASGSQGVSMVDLTTGERKHIGYIRHGDPVPGEVSFTPEGPLGFSWVGRINTKNPIEMNEYMQAEVDFAMAFFKSGTKRETFC